MSSVLTQCFTWKVHPARDLNIVVKNERLLKVTGSHVNWKFPNIVTQLSGVIQALSSSAPPTPTL